MVASCLLELKLKELMMELFSFDQLFLNLKELWLWIFLEVEALDILRATSTVEVEAT